VNELSYNISINDCVPKMAKFEIVNSWNGKYLDGGPRQAFSALVLIFALGQPVNLRFS